MALSKRFINKRLILSLMAKKKTHAKARKAMPKEQLVEKNTWFDAKAKSILAIIGILILAFIIAYSNRRFVTDTSTVAEVNGEKVTIDELNDHYSKLVSDEYKQLITKEYFLNETIIPEMLLLQEAKKKGIKVSGTETETFINDYLAQSGMTKEELETQLTEQGMSYDEFKEFYSDRLKLIKLLNETLGIPGISDDEAMQFYDENKASFMFGNETAAFDDMEEQIKAYLSSQKQQQEIKDYVSDLRQKADIEFHLENIVETGANGGSFMDTGSEICYEDGKPIIRLFSTTTCPHCRWIKNTFDSVVKEYMDSGIIVAYHWELDTGDNTLTDEIEKNVPSSDIQLLQSLNSGGGVPFFVFGCRYIRIGNAYEMDDDLVAEEKDFRDTIELLLETGENETAQETG